MVISQLRRVYRKVDDILSYNTISKFIPRCIQNNIVIAIITRVLLAFTNQRNPIAHVVNFWTNFSIVFLWSMTFKHAGWVGWEWRATHAPISNGVTREWDKLLFGTDVYGFLFCVFSLFMVWGWTYTLSLIIKWHNNKYSNEISALKTMYKNYAPAQAQIELLIEEPESDDETFNSNNNNNNNNRSLKNSSIRSNSNNNSSSLSDNNNAYLNVNGNNNNNSGNIDQFDVEDGSPLNFNDDGLNLQAEFYYDLQRGPNPSCVIAECSGTSNNDNDLIDDDNDNNNSTSSSSIKYNPNLHNDSSPATKPKPTLIAKSLYNLFENVDPWLGQGSPLPHRTSLLIQTLHCVFAWWILNLAWYNATPITPLRDTIGFWHYVVGHPSAPIWTGLYLYIFHPPGAAGGFALALGIQNLAGIWTHLLFPTTPPWFHIMHMGEIPTYDTRGASAGLHRIRTMWNRVSTGFNNNLIVFGAAPSLHGAIAGMCCLFVLYYARSKIVRAAVLFYLTVQWWATMYLTHHYRFDLITGMWYTMGAFAIVFPYLLYQEMLYKKARYVDCDATSPHYRTFGMRVFQNTFFERFFDPYYRTSRIFAELKEISTSVIASRTRDTTGSI